MPILTASVYYSDKGCITPVYIEYSLPNNADCTPVATAPACESSKQYSNLFVQTSCVDDISTFGNKYFGSNTPQVQALGGDRGCQSAASPSFGDQFPLETCVPAGNSSSTTLSQTVFLNTLNGTLFWTSFADANCQTAQNYGYFGTVGSPSCNKEVDQQTALLNYNGLFLYTAYSGSDCKTPAKVSSQAAFSNCSDTSICVQSKGDLEYYTNVCSSVDTSESRAEALFNSKYFALHGFYDFGCVLPKPVVYMLLDTCVNSSPSSTVGSMKSGLSTDGHTITITYWSRPACQGTLVQTDVFPTDGTCTTNGRVFLMSTTGKATSNNVGVIVGGVAAGLFLILAGAFFYFKRNKAKAGKNRTLATQDTVEPTAEGGQWLSVDVVPPPREQPTVATAVTEKSGLFDVLRDATSSMRSSFSGVSPDGSVSPQNMVSSMGGSALASKPTGSSASTNNDKEYALFGDLCLPSLPYQWSVEETSQWLASNEATPAIIQYIKEQDIDGRALLLMSADDLKFGTAGARIRFAEALSSLRSINSSRLAATEAALPPPSYA
ncbi:hypothetical protein BDR26DRAFT_914045 [Obelidium mucronatum]|nr:hypothetical protein BDR26DRAFT_914045 [Obelidium mucronatum]